MAVFYVKTNKMKNTRLVLTIALVSLLSLVCEYTFAQDGSAFLKRGSKVFVIAPDDGAVTHGRNALRSWDYWQVVDDRSQADIVANFKVHASSIGEHKGYLEITEAKTHDIILETKSYNTAFKGRFDTKRSCIEALVDKKLRPLIEN